MFLITKLRAKWNDYLERKFKEREIAYWFSQPLVGKIKNSLFHGETMAAFLTKYVDCTFVNVTFTHLKRVEFDNCFFIGKTTFPVFPTDMIAVHIYNSIMTLLPKEEVEENEGS
jgi:hypothetical protein